MRLTCPKCHAKSTVPDERVPQSGAWARCPQCQERFFIKPRPVDLTSEPDSKPEAPGRAGRSPAAQKLLDRLRSKNGAEADTSLDGPAYGLELPTVFPQKASSPAGCLAVAAVFVAATLIFVFFNYRWTVERSGPTIEMDRSMTPVYDESDLRSDLQSLKFKIARQDYMKYEVAFSGAESRVVKYYISRMAPEMCQEIVRVKIAPLGGGSGFVAEAVCLDDRLRSPRMQVTWEARNAVITMLDRKAQMSLEVFPPERPQDQ
ncbi:hypothetical protein C4J81_03020 [Deltaproteobacteria bacterium Smac51]|nr:hypothetical protein C4J81_03020 [Deltaproteobacteria bacterium Smac51]